MLDGQVSALSEHDARSGQQLDAAVAASQGGRDRVDGVIDGAQVDVDALAPATNTSAGQRALVDALTRRLQETRQTLEDGQADASTRAADADVTAAAYNGVGRFPQPGAPTMPMGGMPAGMPMPQMPMMPTGMMPAMPLSGLSQLVSLFGPQQARAAGGDTFAKAVGYQAGQRLPGTGNGKIHAVIQRALGSAQ